MTAKLCEYNQAMQVFLQQAMVFAREQCNNIKQKLQRRLNPADRSLEKDMDVAERLEKVCKKLQMRSVTMSSATGLAELALVDRLSQALMWSVRSARNEGRINFQLCRSHVLRLGYCADLLFCCAKAHNDGDSELAELWSSAEQLLEKSTAAVKPLPKPPTDLQTASTGPITCEHRRKVLF
jgi:ElaB/YqjD/DUF883 family membrane-anchored ribosome-binding protein